MVDNTATKPPWLVLIVAAHMIFNGHSQAAVTGILGGNISLHFTFDVNITKTSTFAVYMRISPEKHKMKMADYPKDKGLKVLDVYPKTNSLLYHITNLTLNRTGMYWAAVFMTSAKESNMVNLTVQEKNRSTTVPPMTDGITINKDTGSPRFFSSHIVTVLVVLPVVLLIALLPWFIWCLVRTKDEGQMPPRQNSNPTLQETIEVSNNVPASSVVYSVLDFPKRPPTVLEINPNDTEYAAVSYLPEKSQM